jgi:chaperone required for assembly of F1-ATPase
VSDTPKPTATALLRAKPDAPRRFYQSAEAGPHAAGFAVFLDGKVALTPGRKPMVVSSRLVAETLAAEWDAQGAWIDPAAMPLTRLVNVALDRVGGNLDAVRAEIVKYAGSDLLCYRAEGPRALAKAEAKVWDPLVAWASRVLGAPFTVVQGAIHYPQDAATLAAAERALTPLDPLQLAAVHAITTLTGSAILALAVLHSRLSAEAAWAAAHLDEDWQMAEWGRDDVSLRQRTHRLKEMAAAACILAD